MLVTFATPLTGRAAEVGFVTSDGQLDKDFDIFWVDRLESQGHNVTLLSQTYRSADAADVELFIVSNDVNSNDFVAGGADVRRLFHLNPVDLSGHSDVQLTLAMAARLTGWDEGIDFVALRLDTTGDGVYDTQIADFQPLGGDLEDTISGQLLSETFEDLMVPIGPGIDTLRLQVEAFSTATGEQFGLDHIRITGADGVVIGTENFEGGAGQIGFTAEGRGGAGGAFWDLSDAPNVIPEIEFFDFEGDRWFGGADLDAGFGVNSSTHVNDPRPIITYENALFDELGISASGDRTDGDTLDIEDPDHPLAAGLSGAVEISDFFQGITILGDPAAAGTDVIATHDGAPAIAVLEAGAEGINGTPSPRRAIALFPQDTGIGEDYNEAGLALLDASVAYALASGAAPGDHDRDGDLDVDDINALIAEIVQQTNDSNFDLNGDGSVDSTDLQSWVRDLKVTWFGDANLDGEFNSGDFVTVFQAGKFEQDVEAGWHEGDWDGDGRFRSGDFVKAFQDGGFEQGPRAAVAAVPEPAGLGMAVWGLSILLLTWRRQT